MAQSISVIVITSGGANRSVDPWVSLTRTPRSASRRLSCLPAAERGVDVDTRPQSASAHRDHAVADQCLQPPMQPRPQPGGAFLELTSSQHRHHGVTDRRRKGVAAERRAVLAGMQHPENVAIGHHRGQRYHAAAQGLAEQIDVGHHVPVVAGKGPAGAGQAGLNFVGDHENVSGRADLAYFRQVVIRRHDDAGFALDRLQQDCDGVLVDRIGQRGDIPEGHRTEARRERPEAGARSLVR